LLIIWIFGWGGGRSLLEDLIPRGEEKAADQETVHAAKKAAKGNA
jgi:hypothetical protein